MTPADSTPTASPRRGAGAGERGSLSVEVALLIGPALLLILLIVQVGLIAHAKNVAENAAQSAAQAARSINADTGAASSAAAAYVANVGGLNGASVSVSGARPITVTVTGQAPSVVPLPLPAVSATASMPKEEVTSP